MPKSKSRTKKTPKRVLALPDLEHAKTAVLNSLTSASGQRAYDHAIREFVGGTARPSAPRRDVSPLPTVPRQSALILWRERFAVARRSTGLLRRPRVAAPKCSTRNGLRFPELGEGTTSKTLSAGNPVEPGQPAIRDASRPLRFSADHGSQPRPLSWPLQFQTGRQNRDRRRSGVRAGRLHPRS